MVEPLVSEPPRPVVVGPAVERPAANPFNLLQPPPGYIAASENPYEQVRGLSAPEENDDLADLERELEEALLEEWERADETAPAQSGVPYPQTFNSPQLMLPNTAVSLEILPNASGQPARPLPGPLNAAARRDAFGSRRADKLRQRLAGASMRPGGHK